jgi:hypothetical protein
MPKTIKISAAYVCLRMSARALALVLALSACEAKLYSVNTGSSAAPADSLQLPNLPQQFYGNLTIISHLVDQASAIAHLESLRSALRPDLLLLVPCRPRNIHRGGGG